MLSFENTFDIGERVVLRSLNTAKYNGMTGVLVDLNIGTQLLRYRVRLDKNPYGVSGKKLLNVKPANLHPSFVRTHESAALAMGQKYTALRWDMAVSRLDELFIKTPLSIACQKGDVPTVVDLLKMDGVDVNEKHSVGGLTPLIIACSQKHIKVVNILLQSKHLRVNQPAVHSITALHAVSNNGEVEFVRSLLQHPNIDTTLQNEYGLTAEAVARQKGYMEVVRLLQEHDRRKRKENGIKAERVSTVQTETYARADED